MVSDLCKTQGDRLLVTEGT